MALIREKSGNSLYNRREILFSTKIAFINVGLVHRLSTLQCREGGVMRIKSFWLALLAMMALMTGILVACGETDGNGTGGVSFYGAGS